MKAHNILATIGNTPHVRINRLFGADANVWIKSERSNPGGSVKDRIALAMIDWDTTLLNPGQIPAPGLGSVTTAAVAQFDATFPNKILGTAGRPDRYTK